MAHYEVVSIGYLADVIRRPGEILATDKPFSKCPTWLIPACEESREAHKTQFEEVKQQRLAEADAKVARRKPPKVIASATIFDLADYLISTLGSPGGLFDKSDRTLHARQLQLLAYYSVAWSLVWEGHPMVAMATFHAGNHGPYCKSLMALGQSYATKSANPSGNHANLTDDAKRTVRKVISSLRTYDINQLVDLAISEPPFIAAAASDDRLITQEAMREYFQALDEPQTAA